jgi:hypothetical protein
MHHNLPGGHLAFLNEHRDLAVSSAVDLDREGFLNLVHLTRILLQSAVKEIEIKLGVPLGSG